MKIDKIILGTVQFGLDYGINNSNGKISSEESLRILKYAYESGIKVLDTSEKYGNAHEIIGRFHINNPKNKFKIITKFPPNELIDDLNLKVEDYLNDLMVDSLECLMFHSFNSYINNKNIIENLKILKKSKKIKKIGVSIYTNKEMESLINHNEVNVIQIPFNLLDNFNSRGKLIEKAVENNIEIHARSVYLQGLFFKPINKVDDFFNPIKDSLNFIKKLAEKEKISIGNLALNYVISQSLISKVLIGVDSLKQLNENLNYIKYNLNEFSKNNIKKIKISDEKILNPSKW